MTIVSVGEGYHSVRQRGRRQVCRVRLPNEVRAVKAARDEVAAGLSARGWPEHLVDRARVITSELATNAVIHARTGFEVNVLMSDGAEWAWIEVADGLPSHLPVHAEPGHHRPGGMGLYLVDALAEEWGVERDPIRKVVWARISGER